MSDQNTPMGQSSASAQLRAVAAGMTGSFFGLAAIRVWIQCVKYRTYTFTDGDGFSLAINLIFCVFAAVLLAYVAKRGFPQQLRTVLAWYSVTAMSLTGVLMFLGYDSFRGLGILTCTLAGTGLVWGAGSWMEFYLKLQAREALFCALVSLALGALGAMVLGLLPGYVSIMVSIVMPTLSFVLLRQALASVENKSEESSLDGVYGSEPRITWVRLLAGLALFEFVVGIGRGFPFGEAFQLAPGFQIAHQLAVVALSDLAIWLVLGRGRFIRYSALWRIEVVLVAASVVASASLGWWGLSIGSTGITLANSLMLALLWYTAYDVGRHYPGNRFVPLGVIWLVYTLGREVGRAFVLVLPPTSAIVSLLEVFMLLLVSLSIALLFGANVPRTRELFASLRKAVASASPAADFTDPAVAADSTAPSSAPLGRTPVNLIVRYGLTQREAEVVEALVQGKSKAQIAQDLFLSENTVRGYVKNAYAKMDVHSKTQLREKYWGR